MKALFLHAFSVVSSLVKQKDRKLKMYYSTGNFVGLAVRSASDA